MSFVETSKKKKEKTTEKLRSAAMKHSIEESLAMSAGTVRIKSRDPVYHLTESLKTTFDLCGRYNAAELAREDGFPGSSEEETAQGLNQELQTGKSKRNFTGEFPEYQSTPEEKAEGDFYSRFSDIAFRNGHLASAVLQNGGKTMFVSCMSRALGQRGPHNSKQTRLFSATSVQAPIKNSLAKAVFNRYTNGAVGLVVESIHSARQTLQFFERLAAEDPQDAVLSMKEDTLQRLYPFLTISQDTERMAQYEERLKELTRLEQGTNDLEERNEILAQKAVLTAGMTKTQGLIARKRQMKNQFFCLLTQLLENSRKAETIFTHPGFPGEVLGALLDLDEPPEDNNEDDNKGKPEEPSGESEE
ncbi:MAG: hypothetical protein PHU78_02235 [Heliobacteriaceae bacterium]|nr:hypothetical protein [Heliobacteriaceae bacterium]